MKLLKKTLPFFAATLLISSVSQARPQINTPTEITAQPRPSHPPHPGNIKTKLAAFGVGDFDNPIILDQYDQGDITVPASMVPNLQVFFQYYGADLGKGEGQYVPVTPDEELYLFGYNMVFDRWGAPGTTEAQFNGFDLEPAPLTFSGAQTDKFSKVDFYTPEGYQPIYQEGLDPAELDLPDGTVVDRVLYLAFKSECLLDLSEKSPLCPAYRLDSKANVAPGPVPNTTTMCMHKYSQDPEKGGQPDESYNFPLNQAIYFEKTAESGPLHIKFIVK